MGNSLRISEVLNLEKLNRYMFNTHRPNSSKNMLLWYLILIRHSKGPFIYTRFAFYSHVYNTRLNRVTYKGRYETDKQVFKNYVSISIRELK